MEKLTIGVAVFENPDNPRLALSDLPKAGTPGTPIQVFALAGVVEVDRLIWYLQGVRERFARREGWSYERELALNRAEQQYLSYERELALNRAEQQYLRERQEPAGGTGDASRHLQDLGRFKVGRPGVEISPVPATGDASHVRGVGGTAREFANTLAGLADVQLAHELSRLSDVLVGLGLAGPADEAARHGVAPEDGPVALVARRLDPEPGPAAATGEPVDLRPYQRQTEK